MSTMISPNANIRTDIISPSRWNVIIFNDSVTKAEFVIQLLEEVFDHDNHSAIDIMYQVHNEGKAIAGTYFLDIANAKKALAQSKSSKAGFKLRIGIEKS